MDVEFELSEIDLHDKPEEFVELSPTGKVPMLVEDDYVLYESQVINDYLVERYEWDGAYADDLRLKYRQKVTMKQFDSTVLGPFYESLSDPEVLRETEEGIISELEYLNDVVRQTDRSTDNLFAYHFAPFWARMTWLEEWSPFPGWVREITPLSNWLDKSLEQPVIQQTLPDKESAVKTYREE
ncbi:MAG: glutathione S-transferase family protein, partial [bacterium]